MRLTAFTDYGLRALMRLAADPDRRVTTEGLAKELEISRHHLTKVLRRLAEAEIVATHRGSGGGLRLARDPETISLGEIVRLLEARQALVECFRPDGGSCVLSPGCQLKGKLATAEEAFLHSLDRTSLADCAHPRPRRGQPSHAAA